MVKSDPSGAYVIVNPAMVEAYDRIACTVAGSAGAGLDKCLPLTPNATRNANTTGNQTMRSYLMHVQLIISKTCICSPIKNLVPAK